MSDLIKLSHLSARIVVAIMPRHCCKDEGKQLTSALEVWGTGCAFIVVRVGNKKEINEFVHQGQRRVYTCYANYGAKITIITSVDKNKFMLLYIN